MTARRSSTRLATAAVVVMLAGVATGFAEAGAAKSRPGGSRPGATSSAPTRASGRASYGYHRGGRHPHHVGHGHYYGYGFHVYGYPYAYWLGAPYWAWWAYPPPVRVVSASGDGPPGAVETDVRPKRARVVVDGEELGQARDYSGRWDTLWLAPGSYTVELVAPDHMTLRRQVRVHPGGYVRIEERLREGEGIDPRSDPLPAPETAAPPRPATARDEDRTADRDALRRGLLRLEIRPADAAVYLDGEFLARAGELSRLHGALPVAEGRHRVEVARPGYVSETVEVEVRGAEPVRLTIDLERD